MKKVIVVIALVWFGIMPILAQTNNSAKQQYMLVFRFKSDFVPPSQQVLQANIKHWQEFMGGLAQSGKLVSSFRPTGDGRTITGANKTVKEGPYIANNELISSFIIINAATIDEASEIAGKCPIFEFNGSVEIRKLETQMN